MGMPAAKLGDGVTGTCTHVVLVPSPTGPIATPTPFDFTGTITSACSQNVLVAGKPAAIAGSVAVNRPPHVPKSGSFQNPPTNQGKVLKGSTTVLVNGKPAARDGDTVLICNDPLPAPNGRITATGTVLIG